MAKDTFKLKITRACMVQGERVEAGKTVELDNEQAGNLLSSGKARLVRGSGKETERATRAPAK